MRTARVFMIFMRWSLTLQITITNSQQNNISKTNNNIFKESAFFKEKVIQRNINKFGMMMSVK